MDTHKELKHVTSNSFLVVKIGSNDRPATEKDIEKHQEIMKQALGEKFPDLPIIVTHHNFDLQLYTIQE